MKVDLHFHSKYSDGYFWPEELVSMASKQGLEMIALTDHDTFEGVNDFVQAAADNNIIGIPAIEIDFVDNTFGFISELLGYFPKGGFENTLEYISHFQILRRKIVDLALKKAKVLYGFPNLNVAELIHNKIGNNQPRHIYDKISLTKPDIFNYFNYKNLPHEFADYSEFKKNFFNDNEFLELSIKPEFSKCLELINKDDGFPVLAHPAYQFNKDKKTILIEKKRYESNLMEAKRLGLWGIEMHSYDNVEEAKSLNNIFSEIAIDCGLNITYGSDFHGENARNSRQIGCVNGIFYGFVK